MVFYSSSVIVRAAGLIESRPRQLCRNPSGQARLCGAERDGLRVAPLRSTRLTEAVAADEVGR